MPGKLALDFAGLQVGESIDYAAVLEKFLACGQFVLEKGNGGRYKGLQVGHGHDRVGVIFKVLDEALARVQAWDLHRRVDLGHRYNLKKNTAKA